MIAESFAMRQVRRLLVLPRAADQDEVREEARLNELTKALVRCAITEDQAMRMIDRWLAKETFWPVPADIAELAAAVPPFEIGVKPDKECQFCYGCGFEQVFTLETHERGPNGESFKRRERIPDEAGARRLMALVDGRKQVVYSDAAYCRCDYGNELAVARGIRNPRAERAEDLPVVDETYLERQLRASIEQVDKTKRKPPSKVRQDRRQLELINGRKQAPAKPEPITRAEYDKLKAEIDRIVEERRNHPAE